MILTTYACQGPGLQIFHRLFNDGADVNGRTNIRYLSGKRQRENIFSAVSMFPGSSRHLSDAYLSTFNHTKSGDFRWFTIGASFVAFCLVPILATRGQVISLT